MGDGGGGVDRAVPDAVQMEEIEISDNFLDCVASAAAGEIFEFVKWGKIFHPDVLDVWNGAEGFLDAGIGAGEFVGDHGQLATLAGLGGSDAGSDHRRPAGDRVHGWNNVKDFHPIEMVLIAIGVIGTPREREAGIISSRRIPDMGPKGYYVVGAARAI